jgi:hypothetical protein
MNKKGLSQKSVLFVKQLTTYLICHKGAKTQNAYY